MSETATDTEQAPGPPDKRTPNQVGQAVEKTVEEKPSKPKPSSSARQSRAAAAAALEDVHGSSVWMVAIADVESDEAPTTFLGAPAGVWSNSERSQLRIALSRLLMFKEQQQAGQDHMDQLQGSNEHDWTNLSSDQRQALFQQHWAEQSGEPE